MTYFTSVKGKYSNLASCSALVQSASCFHISQSPFFKFLNQCITDNAPSLLHFNLKTTADNACCYELMYLWSLTLLRADMLFFKICISDSRDENNANWWHLAKELNFSRIHERCLNIRRNWSWVINGQISRPKYNRFHHSVGFKMRFALAFLYFVLLLLFFFN